MRAVRVAHPRALVLGVLVGRVCSLLGGTAAPVQAAGKPASGLSVTAALASLQRSGAIAPAIYQQDYSAYVAAVNWLKNFSGTRRSELGAVLANVRAIAAAGGFIPSRLPALFLTLERNRTWWTTGSLLASRVRISFPGSKLVWEYYSGQGIEIQWLGTFGEGNGFYSGGQNKNNLKRARLGELIPLATKRAGGIAWEYMFQFDGGLPPGRAASPKAPRCRCSRADWSRFKEPAVLTAAQEALGIFKTLPPSRSARRGGSLGAHYLEYTYAPTDRILNGEIQALVGLYDYTSITEGPRRACTVRSGRRRRAGAGTPLYDTGAWSMYDQFGESDLNYHELLTEFLDAPVRTHAPWRAGPVGPPPAPAPAPAPTPTTPTTTTPAGGTAGGTTETSGASGGASAARHTAQTAASTTTSSASAIPGDAIYCTTAEHFTA